MSLDRFFPKLTKRLANEPPAIRRIQLVPLEKLAEPINRQRFVRGHKRTFDDLFYLPGFDARKLP